MDNNTKLFTEKELLEMKQDNQHQELMLLLSKIASSPKESLIIKEITSKIDDNAKQFNSLLEAIKNIKFELPTQNVSLPESNIVVNVEQEDVIKSFNKMFSEMKSYLIESTKASEQLSKDVMAMNESYLAEKTMTVKYNYGVVEKIIVTVKK